MAEGIPDRLPRNATTGECRIFDLLKRLPDDCLIYYEPIVHNHHPDFVVLIPSLGLLVIELKGWREREILGGDLDDLTIRYNGEPCRKRHPIRQAREYMFALKDTCQRHPALRPLTHASGPHRGNFTFPFGNFSILSQITYAELEAAGKASLFPRDRVMTREVLSQWEEMNAEDSVALLKSYFAPWWRIDPLTPAQVDLLRAVIHPEVMLLPFARESTAEQPSLAVLDRRQENHARNLGRGHRIIYGIAGSGKTAILVARAKLVAQTEKESEFLFLCFNVALAVWLRGALAGSRNIRVIHFDGWSREQGVERQDKECKEDNDSLGERLLKVLQSGHGHTRRYKGIFIDEAQDFAASWFRCVLESMEDSLDGDLIIVGDGNQGVYRNRDFSWADVGVQAVGRTVHTKFDLDQCYRSTKEIMGLASCFGASLSAKSEAGLAAMGVHPDQCVRSSGYKPVLCRAKNLEEECQRAVQMVADLREGRWFGQQLPRPLEASEIGILYRKAPGDQAKALLADLERSIPDSIWINNRERPGLGRIVEPGVKIQTVHSSKGLQYRAVLLLWAGQLPSSQKEDDLMHERRLLFVALSRAEDYLTLLYSKESDFVSEILKRRDLYLEH